MSLILGMIFGGSGVRTPEQHRAGRTKNYASAEYRAQNEAYLRGQRAKGGVVGQSGWNSDAARLGSRSAAAEQYTTETYPLGAPSVPFLQKFGKWGAQGPRSASGWKYNLTQAPKPQSTFAPSQMFKQEVYQTRETRKSTQRFRVLHRHPNQSKLNPNLAHMFKETGEVGAVRRSTRRYL